jgi:hypothetical protein
LQTATALSAACTGATNDLTQFDLETISSVVKELADKVIHDPDVALALADTGISRSLVEKVLNVDKGASLVQVIAKQALAFTAPAYHDLTVRGQ